MRSPWRHSEAQPPFEDGRSDPVRHSRRLSSAYTHVLAYRRTVQGSNIEADLHRRQSCSRPGPLCRPCLSLRGIVNVQRINPGRDGIHVRLASRRRGVRSVDSSGPTRLADGAGIGRLLQSGHGPVRLGVDPRIFQVELPLPEGWRRGWRRIRTLW
jgi:hypothetical protein